MVRTPRAARAAAIDTPPVSPADMPKEVAMPTVSTTTAEVAEHVLAGAIRAAELSRAAMNASTPAPAAPASTALAPYVPHTPLAYGAHVLRSLLAGGDLDIDPEALAMAIGAMERPAMPAPATTARASGGTIATPRSQPHVKGRVGYGGRTAPETGPNGEKLRKLWTVKDPIGPFLVGCVTGPGGAAVWVVRDTRTNTDHAEPKHAYARVGQAQEHARAACANANLTPEAMAQFEKGLRESGRIGTDKTAR